MADNLILSVKGISKYFPGVKALDNVSFDVVRGHIHALVGENGAGKSTLIKILSGVYSASEGEVIYNGKPVKINSPLEAQMLGISVVHQELKLVETLSVAENIFLGRPITKRKSSQIIDWKQQFKEAQKLLDRLNVSLDLNKNVGKLSVAQKQIVEICKALSFDSELIIMDEPSATLTEKELDLLFQILKMLKEKGVTIIYISHRLEEIFKIADRVTVLRDGKHIETRDVKDIDRKTLIAMMVGRELENEYPKVPAPIGDVLLEVKNLNRRNVLHNISFTLKKGEILGIAGLVGSGRTELARAIFGADTEVKGEIYIKGQKVSINNVTDAIEKKIALVPEDRKQQGLVLDMTVKENISMVGIDKVLTRGIINSNKERNLAKRFIEALRIATPDEERQVKFLSGGNQQKVVLSKWLAVESDIIIFDEPTRGVDVGAKAEIYKILNNLVAEGKGVIMISSELPEILGMCDRILVMHDGKITGEVLREDATQEIIMEYATR
ncbi:MAG TPA: sugar ABC transporter ATP-binding protein [Clostridiaceae bacterium]|nr:sugar ABC transporter ATP-binding protein [Clostridiaceae bacterium]